MSKIWVLAVYWFCWITSTKFILKRRRCLDKYKSSNTFILTISKKKQFYKINKNLYGSHWYYFKFVQMTVFPKINKAFCYKLKQFYWIAAGSKHFGHRSLKVKVGNIFFSFHLFVCVCLLVIGTGIIIFFLLNLKPFWIRYPVLDCLWSKTFLKNIVLHLFFCYCFFIFSEFSFFFRVGKYFTRQNDN